MDTTDGLVRGQSVKNTGAPISMPVGPEVLGRILNVIGEPVDEAGPVNAKKRLADPPLGAEVHRPVGERRDVRDRHQGHRPARAVPQRRQDRPVRRRRRRQDGAHPGADQQRREEVAAAYSVFAGVGERTREGNDLFHELKEAKLFDGSSVLSKTALVFGQMNEPPGARAARRALGAHGRRVLPRRDEAGPAAVRRQHLPLHAGGLRSVGAPRPHPERRRLPADALDRDGRAAGAHHVDEGRLDHVGAGDLRARRRPHRPGAGDGVRPPRRDDGAQPRDHGEGHLPGRRSARLDVDDPRRRRRRRAPLQASRARSSASCSATRISRTSSRSSAWTSSARTTSSRSSRARKIEKFFGQPFHVAETFTGLKGIFCSREDTVRSVRGDPRRQVRRPARAGVRDDRHDRRRPRQGRRAGEEGASRWRCRRSSA